MYRTIFEGLAKKAVIGLIGAGKFGMQLKAEAHARGHRVLLCDPPKAAEAAEEVCDAFLPIWGNGMGGCDFSRAETETYLPMETLARTADLIAIQVPLNDSTRGMIDEKFMFLCRARGTAVYNFSDPAVVCGAVQHEVRRVTG